MKKMKSLLGLTLATYLVLNPLSVYALSKNETVYTSLDENGKIVISSVTNHIKIGNETEITDDTELKNILNINGKETFTLNKNTLKWKSAGRDIFYRGETDKEQPIDVSIEYYLDGKKMDAKDMVSKKGSVKIVLRYQNKLSNQVNINGKNETIYTPFVVTTGMYFNNDNNKNIKVHNGKSINSGSRTMVVGVSAPGLYESLGIDELKELDTITITYDTTKFSLGSIYMVATPKLLEENDLDVFHKLNDLTSNIDLLQSSMNKIEEGAKKLDTGSSALSNGANEISSNLKNVTEAITQLKGGTGDLKNGLTYVASELDKAITGIAAQMNVSSLEEAKQQLLVLKTQNQTIIDSVLQATGMTEDDLKVYQGNNTTILQAQLLYMNNQVVNQSIASLTLLPTLKDGLESLKEGSIMLESSLTELEAGTKQLSDGAIALAQGAKELDSGIDTLNTGITQINKEGINPLHRYSSLMRTYSSKLEAMTKLSREYHGYATSSADETLFIYMIKGVK